MIPSGRRKEEQREGGREGGGGGSGGDEIEQRTELRAGSGGRLTSFRFHFLLILPRGDSRVGTFHAHEAPKIQICQPDGADQPGNSDRI